MKAVGVVGYYVNGAEATALDVLEVEGNRVSWTVALPNAGPGMTFDTEDPAVAEFLRLVFGFRMLPGHAPTTSASGTAGPPPGPA